MSDHMPFDNQAEIMKRLPVKSLLRCRSVSKPWKSLIDSSEFINSYRKNQQHQRYIFVGCKEAADDQKHVSFEGDDDIYEDALHKAVPDQKYVSIVDDDTFPNQKSSLFAPGLLSLLSQPLLLSSVNGLLCFCGSRKDVGGPLKIVVLWNPTIRKSVGIVIPNVMLLPRGSTYIGFGVCPNSSDPKLVKINCMRNGSLMTTVDWEVEVFRLSTRVWKTVSNIPLAFKSCDLTCEAGQVSVGGFIYWYAFDKFKLGGGIQSNMIVSFDLKSDEFGEVCLPDRLVHSDYLRVMKFKESLGLLECDKDGEVPICSVWIMNEGVTKSFTKMFNVKIIDVWRYKILEFRNNGEAIIETAPDNVDSSVLEVCEPCSGHHNDIGIEGEYDKYSVKSYMETLLLLDQSNSILH